MRRPAGKARGLTFRGGWLGALGFPLGKVEFAVLDDCFCKLTGNSRSTFFGSVDSPQFKLHSIDSDGLVTSIGLDNVTAREPSLLFSVEGIWVNDPASGL